MRQQLTRGAVVSLAPSGAFETIVGRLKPQADAVSFAKGSIGRQAVRLGEVFGPAEVFEAPDDTLRLTATLDRTTAAGARLYQALAYGVTHPWSTLPWVVTCDETDGRLAVRQVSPAVVAMPQEGGEPPPRTALDAEVRALEAHLQRHQAQARVWRWGVRLPWYDWRRTL